MQILLNLKLYPKKTTNGAALEYFDRRAFAKFLIRVSGCSRRSPCMFRWWVALLLNAHMGTRPLQGKFNRCDNVLVGLSLPEPGNLI